MRSNALPWASWSSADVPGSSLKRTMPASDVVSLLVVELQPGHLAAGHPRHPCAGEAVGLLLQQDRRLVLAQPRRGSG